MKYTNHSNLPQEIVAALTKNRYSGTKNDGSYSVTTLKSPPRIVQLERRHWDEVESDALDNLWSMFGHMAHSLLEEHGSDESLTEERLHLDILGRDISGQVDHYKDGKITDYKVTSAWTLVYGSRIVEWTEQLNMYAYLFSKHNYEVKQIEIVAILRDWDKNKALAGGNYPNSPIQIIPITLWDEQEQEDYIMKRIKLQIENEDKSDEDLSICTPEERWDQPSKYAVMKEGAKRATKLFDSKEEANNYILDSCPDNWDKNGHSKDLYITVTRQGKRTRCSDFCSVNKFCSVYQEYLKEIANG